MSIIKLAQERRLKQHTAPQELSKQASQDLFQDQDPHELRRAKGDTLFKIAYKELMVSFTDFVLEHGWQTAVESFDRHMKHASLGYEITEEDEWGQGRQLAQAYIHALDQDPLARGWFTFLKVARDIKRQNRDLEALCTAMLECELEVDQDVDEGACQAAQAILDHGGDIEKVAFTLPPATMKAMQRPIATPKITPPKPVPPTNTGGFAQAAQTMAMRQQGATMPTNVRPKINPVPGPAQNTQLTSMYGQLGQIQGSQGQ
jgi:hypothetical protein